MGQGECVGIVELGGGERMADLRAYFSALGIGSAPKVTAVSVDHGKTQPTGDPNGPDGGGIPDIQGAGPIPPQPTITGYFPPNTRAGFPHPASNPVPQPHNHTPPT